MTSIPSSILSGTKLISDTIANQPRDHSSLWSFLGSFLGAVATIGAVRIQQLITRYYRGKELLFDERHLKTYGVCKRKGKKHNFSIYIGDKVKKKKKEFNVIDLKYDYFEVEVQERIVDIEWQTKVVRESKKQCIDFITKDFDYKIDYFSVH